ncbi:hypothetical protein L218DRAFT_1077745 [Marasmius fiardii PR-910]|nr:hypothetical protein L218DRAFT_1077745 [Marasmius fiardii PR-910]
MHPVKKERNLTAFNYDDISTQLTCNQTYAYCPVEKARSLADYHENGFHHQDNLSTDDLVLPRDRSGAALKAIPDFSSAITIELRKTAPPDIRPLSPDRVFYCAKKVIYPATDNGRRFMVFQAEESFRRGMQRFG